MDKMKMIILKQDRYNKVKDGSMTVWLTLNDEWARSIQPDEIVRIMNDNTSDVCYVRVNGFYVYPTFDELYKRVDKGTIGYDKKNQDNIAKIKKDMSMQCLPEHEKQHGVRGIKFEYLPNFKTIDEMEEQEFNDYIDEVSKQTKKALKQTSNHLDKLDDLLGFLTSLAKHSPYMLLGNTDPLKLNGLKFLMLNRIDDMKQFIEIVEKQEKELDYPTPDEYADDMID